MYIDDGLAFDCLGCLMDAHERGEIDDDSYNEVLDILEHDPTKGICPKCGESAYISEFELGMMHCPQCGWYSFREGEDDDWEPQWQGTACAAHTA